MLLVIISDAAEVMEQKYHSTRTLLHFKRSSAFHYHYPSPKRTSAGCNICHHLWNM